MESDSLNGNAVNLAMWSGACRRSILQPDALADYLPGIPSLKTQKHEDTKLIQNMIYKTLDLGVSYNLTHWQTIFQVKL